MDNNENVKEQASNAVTYSLDGRQITLLELNEARNKPGVHIKETAPGVYKTLQRLNG
jgi:hypothetical protein